MRTWPPPRRRYTNACVDLNVAKTFDTPDLFEARNMKAVVQNIHALARTARGLPPGTFNGPFLATKAPVVTL